MMTNTIDRHGRRRWALGSILACIAASAAPAQNDAQIRAAFDRLDADKNGYLQRGEFPGSARQFRDIDRNKNGRITVEELTKSAFGKLLRSARERNKLPPRPRVDPDALTLRRLQNLRRFDTNGDGKLVAKEWRGDPAALRSMDLDGDGDADKKDLAIARSRAPQADPATFAALTAELPEAGKLLKKLDRNRDGNLSAKELRGQKFAPLVTTFDRNRDGELSRDELETLVKAVQAYIKQRDQRGGGNAKARAYSVPFSTWDKNKDGRLESGEWLERNYLFPRYDRNRDGAVTKEEVERYTKFFEGESFVERFDLNGDRAVTQAEFGGPFEVFGRLDRNGDGVINRADR